MTITKVEIQLQWDAGSDDKSVGAAGNATGDEFNPSAEAVEGSLVVKVVNSDGTPVEDDVLAAWLLMTLGDPDGAGADEFATPGSGLFLEWSDTFNDGVTTIYVVTGLSANFKGGKLYVENDGASSMTVSAAWYEMKA